MLDTIAGWLTDFGFDPNLLTAKGLEAATILTLAWAGLWMARRVARRYENRQSEEMSDTLEMETQRASTIAQLANSVARAAIFVTAALMLLNLVVPIGPLLAGVGVLGLALSFGAQSLVKDIISGFFILAENQFAVGDNIEIDGTSGAVERLTLRVVVLRDVEGVVHTIPNGSITKVSNRTKSWARALLEVSVAYSTDVDHAIAVLKDLMAAFAQDEEWGPRLVNEPQVPGVQRLGEDGVYIRVVADTRPGRQWDVRRELNRRIKNRFDEEGIEIPFPQRTVHLRNT